MTTEKTHNNCPGTGCTDQGCPAHYADSTNLTNLITAEHTKVAKLVKALEGLLAIIDESLGVSGYHLNGNMAAWCEFDEVEMAEEALAIYRQQRGEL